MRWIMGLFIAICCLQPWVVAANDRGERSGPYTYIYIADWSKLRHQAEQGDPDALFRIGNLYYQPPDGSGITQSYKRAFLAFYEAALNNHSTAQHNVGAMYINGDYVAHDLIEGYAWMLLSASYDDAAGKRKVKEYSAEISDEGKAHAKARVPELREMVETARRKRDFRPERYGVR